MHNYNDETNMKYCYVFGGFLTIIWYPLITNDDHEERKMLKIKILVFLNKNHSFS